MTANSKSGIRAACLMALLAVTGAAANSWDAAVSLPVAQASDFGEIWNSWSDGAQMLCVIAVICVLALVVGLAVGGASSPPSIPSPLNPSEPRIVIRARSDVASVDAGGDAGNVTVIAQRKPGRCPMCATTGCVTENPRGRPKWKCSECGHLF